MRKSRIIGSVIAALLIAGGIAAFAIGWRPAIAAIDPPAPQSFDAALVKRGRELAAIGNCNDCHTVRGGKNFAGGLPVPTPFGTIFSSNITPDAETGIGRWPEAAFRRAMRSGVDRDGQHLYPTFPYDHFTNVTDEDDQALYAYLMTRQPVHAPARANQLSFPLDQRFVVAGWKLLFLRRGTYQPDSAQSAEWNRGAYFSETLAHCGECHTPRNLAFALDNRKKFGGALTAGWRAYNISGDGATGVGAWSDSELEQYLATGHAEGRGTASGPMGEAVDASFRYLVPSDIHAIVAYLRTVPAVSSDLPAKLAGPASASPRQPEVSDARGKMLFAGACAGCHSWTGQSPIWTQATLTGARAVNDPSAINVAQIVVEGASHRTSNGTVFMPAFGASFSDSEIAAVANYVTARFGSKGSAITARDVAGLRKQAAR